MKTAQMNESNREVCVQLWRKENAIRRLLLITTILFVGTISARAQVTIELPQIVLEVKHTEYVQTQNPGAPQIMKVKSSNPSVATALVYRVTRVQIVAVAPGKTTVEFWDNQAKVLYRQPVWVEAANASGGGGSGYNPRLTQLQQLVMLAKHTQNVTVPGGGPHRISDVKSSNVGVATARTNTANTIQVYSVALGDTWIEFTDNATGKNYQVHVWVKNSLAAPNGEGAGSNSGGKGGGSGGGGAGASGSGAGGAAAGGGSRGSIDPCLVGSWEATSVEFLAPYPAGMTGATGFRVTFKRDGTETIDYSAMKPVAFSDSTPAKPDNYAYSGVASAHISTDKKTAKIESIDGAGVTRTINATGYHIPLHLPDLGPGALGNTANNNNYSCTEDSLEYQTADTRGQNPNFSFKLTRLKN